MASIVTVVTVGAVGIMKTAAPHPTGFWSEVFVTLHRKSRLQQQPSERDQETARLHAILGSALSPPIRKGRRCVLVAMNTMSEPQTPCPQGVCKMSQLLQIEPWECVALQLLAKGMSSSELAAALHLPESEIDARLAVLFTRMGVKTQREAAAECVKRGLLFAAALWRGSSTAPRVADPGRELSAIGGSAHQSGARWFE